MKIQNKAGREFDVTFGKKYLIVTETDGSKNLHMGTFLKYQDPYLNQEGYWAFSLDDETMLLTYDVIDLTELNDSYCLLKQKDTVGEDKKMSNKHLDNYYLQETIADIEKDISFTKEQMLKYADIDIVKSQALAITWHEARFVLDKLKELL